MNKVKKILIVEDDRLTRFMLKYRLEKRGYNVLMAKDEKEFWDQAFDHELDLIILDICLKNRLGTDIYQSLLDFGMNRNLPVIFTTGLINDAEEAARKTLNKNFSFLPKPLDFEKLNSEIERLSREALSDIA